MKLIAGVDIGNSTTEVCIGRVKDNGVVEFLSSGLTKTTGTKGTTENVKGIKECLELALSKISKKVSDLDIIRLNEAAPVIGDTAMETITETIITESTLIGHNPKTPGGEGICTGHTIHIEQIDKAKMEKSYVVVIPESVSYEEAAEKINQYIRKGINIQGAIVQSDEGVLICNRLDRKIPIVDEVREVNKVPIGMLSAVEVAPIGQAIQTLSNPYGIASIFGLNAEETKYVMPIAKCLLGTRSAVVIKTPAGEVKERVIPAGKLFFYNKETVENLEVDAGSEEIMKKVSNFEELEDIEGEGATNIGGMIHSVKNNMAKLTERDMEQIKIKDLLAVDTMIPLEVHGGIAGETSMEKAVAVAVMVKADRLPMERVANKLQEETGIFVEIAGVEAVMATLGAITTPGTTFPLAILDLGGGSTDAALLDERGKIKSIHLAGAGDLITMLINSELCLNNKAVAEEIKKNPVAKVENPFQLRLENGDIKFFEEPLSSEYYGSTVIVRGKELVPIQKEISVEKIVQVRKQAKEKVFIQNALRALKQVAPMKNIRNIPNVVLVGGSALDFEIPDMILRALSQYKVVSGRGNIRQIEGPRNAVATGLVMSYIQGKNY